MGAMKDKIMKRAGTFLDKHSTSWYFLAFSSFLTILVLGLFISYVGTMIHELGHAIADMFLFPENNSVINNLQGFETSFPFPVIYWQVCLFNEAGPITSFIALNICIWLIIPRINPGRHLLKLALLIFCFTSIINSTLYHAIAFIPSYGDTRNAANVINWYWGLSYPQGDPPFDSAIILSILGVGFSCIYCYLTYKTFKFEIIAFLGKRYLQCPRKVQKYLPLGLCVVGYLSDYIIYKIFDSWLENGRNAGFIYANSWNVINMNSLIIMLLGLMVFGIIGLMYLLNKEITGRSDPSQYQHNKNLIAILVIVMFFIFLFPVAVVHYSNLNYQETPIIKRPQIIKRTKLVCFPRHRAFSEYSVIKISTRP